GQDIRAAAGAELFHPPLQRPGVLRQDAYAFIGRQQPQAEGTPLPQDLQIPAEQDEHGPGEGKIAGDLLRPQQQPAEALRRPPRPQVAAGNFAAGRPLPERHTNGRDEGQSQNQQRPFAGLSLRARDRHAASRSKEVAGGRSGSSFDPFAGWVDFNCPNVEISERLIVEDGRMACQGAGTANSSYLVTFCLSNPGAAVLL